MIVPFKVKHLRRLDVQPRHREDLLKAIEDPGSVALEGIFAETLMDGEEHPTPIACCGIFTPPYNPQLPRLGYAWAFLSKDLRRHMVKIVRRLDRSIKDYETICRWPVVADVDEDHVEGVRLVRALGFQPYQGTLWRHM